MAEEVAALVTRLEANVKRFEAGLERARRTMDRQTGRIERRARQLDDRLARVGNRFGINLNPRVIAATAAVTAFGKAVNDIVRNGDRLRQLEGRFKALTGSAERAGDLVQRAFGIGAETGAPFGAVSAALARFRLAADAVGATDEEVARLTETVLKLAQIGSSTSQELTAGSIQLAQALASGRLQGDELRSVLENIPLVARQIADGLGVGVGQLREMGQAGELTAERVFGALLRGSERVDQQFAQLPDTVERAANRAASAWARFTAELNESLGVSNAIVGTLNALSDTMEKLSGQKSPLARQLEEARAALAEAESQPFFRSDEEIQRLRERVQQLERAVRQSTIARTRDAFGEPLARRGQKVVSRVAPTSSPTPMRPPPELGIPDLIAADNTAREMLNALRERIELLRQEQALVGRDAVERARLSAAFEKERILRELLNAAAKEGATITPEEIEQAKALADEFERQAVTLAEMEEALQAKKRAEEDAARAAEEHRRRIEEISNALIDAIANARNFKDALRAVAAALAKLAFSGGPTGAGLFGSLVSGLLPGVFGSAAPMTSPLPVPKPIAKGAAFSQGAIMPFARGGIVDRPTLFPMARGTGLMGEAGPEAVLPLRRGRGGRLGVEASGAGLTRVRVELSPDLVAHVLDRARGQSVEIVQSGLREYDQRQLPRSLDRVNRTTTRVR